MANAEFASMDRSDTAPSGRRDDAMRYTHFLAAPMSALPREEFGPVRDWAMALVQALEARSGYRSVYFAGRAIQSSADFTDPDLAVKHDLEALKSSRSMIYFYPRACMTSAHFELGIAVALGMDVTIVTPDRSQLLFLLQHPAQIEALQFGGKVRLIEYGSQPPIASELAAAL